jgi:hypothetical protein
MQQGVSMSTLRFTRDETSNAVSFLIKGPAKTTRLTLTLNDFALALMAGKEVQCSMSIPKEPEVKKKKKKGKK